MKGRDPGPVIPSFLKWLYGQIPYLFGQNGQLPGQVSLRAGRKTQRNGRTHRKKSAKKRASKVQVVPESPQKSNIVARTGSEPNK